MGQVNLSMDKYHMAIYLYLGKYYKLLQFSVIHTPLWYKRLLFLFA